MRYSCVPIIFFSMGLYKFVSLYMGLYGLYFLPILLVKLGIRVSVSLVFSF